MVAQEERGREGGVAVADEGLDGRGEGDEPERPALQKVGHGLAESGRGAGELARLFRDEAAGLLEGEERQGGEEEARRPGHQEGRAPAVGVGDEPAHDQAQQAADGRAHGVERQGRRALLLGGIVDDQRVGGGVHPASPTPTPIR